MGSQSNRRGTKWEKLKWGACSRLKWKRDYRGNYVSLAKFINALERDEMFFIIDSIALAGEQKGPIKLQMKFETYLKAGA